MCSPVAEGGLGIRSLHQIQAGLLAKLMWLALLDQNLWETFVRAKYFVGNSSVVPHTAKSFWLDNWTGQILLGPQPVDANLTIAQGLAIYEDIKNLIRDRNHGEIEQAVLAMETPDKLIYTPSDCGIF